MIHPMLANWIVGVVTGVWLANFLAALVPSLNYKPDPAIHGVFMLVAGGALALKRNNKKNGDGNGESP